ncbi:MAG: hypothetical protein AAGF12_28720 [Myxococcota bacterium]
MQTTSAEANADLALAVYLEPFIEGRRVLWIGDPDAAAEDRLADQAALLKLWVQQGGRRGRTRRNTLRPGPLTLREESFDLVVVPEADTVGLFDGARIDELRSAVGSKGVLVIGVTATDEHHYEALYDLVADRFASHRLVGQVAQDGWALVTFGDENPEVTVDTSSIADPSPTRFLAVCNAETALESYAVIATPASAASSDVREFQDTATMDVSSEGAEELAAALDHAEQVEVALADRTLELETLRSKLEDTVAERDAQATAAQRAEEAQASTMATLDELRARLSQPDATEDGGEHQRLESLLAERARALRDAKAEVERRGTLVRDLVEQLREVGFDAGVSPTDGAAFRPTLAPAEVTRRAEGSVAAPPVPKSPPIPPVPSGTEDTLRQGDLQTADLAVTAATERAVSAEAARSAAEFAADELRGQLLEWERTERDAERARAADEGKVRGLRARIAELTELHQMAQARLSLAENDLANAEERRVGLERQAQELRERLELEIVRSVSSERESTPETESTPAAESIPSTESVPETESAPEPDDRATQWDREKQRLEARIEELGRQNAHFELLYDAARDQCEKLTVERDALKKDTEGTADRQAGAALGYGRRIAELRDTVRRLEAELGRRLEVVEEHRLRGELEGLRFRLADREAALEARDAAALRASGAEAEDAARTRENVERERDEARDELDRLRAEVESLSARDSALTLRLSDAEELAELEAGRAADLAQTVAARDALVARLQLDLVDEERARHDAEALETKAGEETARLREALLDASASIDKVETLQKQIATLDEAKAAAEEKARSSADAARAAEAEVSRARGVAEGLLGTVEAQRKELRQLRAELVEALDGLGKDEPRVPTDITAVGMDAPDLATPEPPPSPSELAALREEIRRLEDTDADRETLLRSLTAQLEERDDRVRALERRLEDEQSSDKGVEGDEETLRRVVLELQERSSRLSEELLHERKARRAAEAGSTRAAGDESELRRLRSTVDLQETDLNQLRRKLLSSEREGKNLREASASARAALEELLGDASADGNPAAAERIGALLRILS